jgi:hypothetical protein
MKQRILNDERENSYNACAIRRCNLNGAISWIQCFRLSLVGARMSDWLFPTLFLLLMGFIIFNGALMLLAPATHRRFLFWFARAHTYSRPLKEEPRGLEVQRRLAGVAMAGMGIYVAWNVILGSDLGERKTGANRSVMIHGGNVFSLVAAACLLTLGAFITFWLQLIVEWSKWHQPIPSEVPDSTLATWKFGARLLGTAFVLGEIYTLWVALN